ncbi:ATPase [Acuticoccus sediminis]|uniref:ATPase n=1 Tax=Acuticoccus sediminis TaxID=2184697 RepID=A0A8B2NE11_9HYPH|nr:ATP12 family protein [Acuticoccus sediminis]RAH97009.1 ATPase [Acuticoccus sediminis]
MTGRDTTPRPPEPIRRFYKEATVAPHAGGEARILLDNRPVRTPAKAHLAAPPSIAERIAAEWNAQGDYILPISMPMTRLANTAIDGVTAALDPVKDDIAKMAQSDLVMYRADFPAGLVAEQKAHWDPVVAFAEDALGVRIMLAEGIMPVEQDPRLSEGVRRRLPATPLPLAAFHQLTTLTGSALTTLAFTEALLDFERAWQVAHVDEDWNIREWGEDAEAAARRAQRRKDAEAAAFVLRPEAVPAAS